MLWEKNGRRHHIIKYEPLARGPWAPSGRAVHTASAAAIVSASAIMFTFARVDVFIVSLINVDFRTPNALELTSHWSRCSHEHSQIWKRFRFQPLQPFGVHVPARHEYWKCERLSTDTFIYRRCVVVVSGEQMSDVEWRECSAGVRSR